MSFETRLRRSSDEAVASAQAVSASARIDPFSEE